MHQIHLRSADQFFLSIAIRVTMRSSTKNQNQQLLSLLKIKFMGRDFKLARTIACRTTSPHFNLSPSMVNIGQLINVTSDQERKAWWRKTRLSHQGVLNLHQKFEPVPWILFPIFRQI